MRRKLVPRYSQYTQCKRIVFMKKILVVSLAVLSAFCIRATDQNVDLQKAAEVADRLSNARVVKYVVTLYCDADKAQRSEWNDVVNRAVETLTLGESDTAQEADLIDSVIRSLEALKTKHRSGVIAGSISVGLGDGQCAPEKCGQSCQCVKKTGVCACSAINGEQCCCR